MSVFNVLATVILTIIYISLLKKVYAASYEKFFNGEIMSQAEEYRIKHEKSTSCLAILAIGCTFLSFLLTASLGVMCLKTTPYLLQLVVSMSLFIFFLAVPRLISLG
ncbi:MAG: hypothetical protein ACD_56C00008G0005 [uncultured bacterium]|nr:MAG: hypothetical protein ACD_56C00008G0005 [uncultured bacterium]